MTLACHPIPLFHMNNLVENTIENKWIHNKIQSTIHSKMSTLSFIIPLGSLHYDTYYWYCGWLWCPTSPPLQPHSQRLGCRPIHTHTLLCLHDHIVLCVVPNFHDLSALLSALVFDLLVTFSFIFETLSWSLSFILKTFSWSILFRFVMSDSTGSYACATIIFTSSTT